MRDFWHGVHVSLQRQGLIVLAILGWPFVLVMRNWPHYWRDVRKEWRNIR